VGRKPQLVVAVDGALFCEGLRALIEAGGHFQVARQTDNGADALRLTTEMQPDVLVLDAGVPRFPGVAALRDVVGEPSPTRIVLLSASLAGSTVPLAVDIGARGLVLKNSSADILLAAIRAVADDESWVDREIVPDFATALYRRCMLGAASSPWRHVGLTPRECQIVAAVAAACTNKDIANRFAISETTVKHHLTSIFGKVGVSSRLALATFAVSHGLHPMGLC
jgi:DNA-binding NarL/FixJ family response regulator